MLKNKTIEFKKKYNLCLELDDKSLQTTGLTTTSKNTSPIAFKNTPSNALSQKNRSSKLEKYFHCYFKSA